MVNMGDDAKVTDMVCHTAFKISFLDKVYYKEMSLPCKRNKVYPIKSDSRLIKIKAAVIPIMIPFSFHPFTGNHCLASCLFRRKTNPIAAIPIK
jgi:hypothetical protein